MTSLCHSIARINCDSIVFVLLFFFFNDTATTEIYTLSLHDALPISADSRARTAAPQAACGGWRRTGHRDRKSTRLNSSHLVISYAVFCLKKKKKPAIDQRDRASCSFSFNLAVTVL